MASAKLEFQKKTSKPNLVFKKKTEIVGQSTYIIIMTENILI